MSPLSRVVIQRQPVLSNFAPVILLVPNSLSCGGFLLFLTESGRMIRESITLFLSGEIR
ncbi:MAG: hypothetical protein L6Q59_03885 [Ignavibacteriaceae bacterium]|nr:hypothetical protein [Ignavibacteriaceae bacterium]